MRDTEVSVKAGAGGDEVFSWSILLFLSGCNYLFPGVSLVSPSDARYTRPLVVLRKVS